MAKHKNVSSLSSNPRGFAAMSPEKQHEIASKGGKAYHEVRGFQAMDPEKQREIASKGGSAPHEVRGFQAMAPQKQKEIASKGGKASRRTKAQEKDNYRSVHERGFASMDTQEQIAENNKSVASKTAHHKSRSISLTAQLNKDSE